MGKIKAKKKRPIDVESHRYTYEEMKEISNRIANEKAIQLYREYATQNATETGLAVIYLHGIVLNDIDGYGKKRLGRVRDEVTARLQDFQEGKYTLEELEEVYSEIMK